MRERLDLLRDGVSLLQLTRARLHHGAGRSRLEPMRLVEEVGTRLAELAAVPDCPSAIEVALLDLRDRLDSFALSARWLAEAGIAVDVRLDLLRRGLDEVVAHAHEQVVRLGGAPPLLPTAPV